MKAHDRYYGEALREAESGKRRDDLWGRALAQARGDTQAASGIYIDLLATRLESEAGSPEKLSRAVEAAAVVGAVGVAAVQVGAAAVQRSMPLVMRLFWLAVRVVVSGLLAFGFGFAAVATYSYVKTNEVENVWVTAMYDMLNREVSLDQLRKEFESGNDRMLFINYPTYAAPAVERKLGFDAFERSRDLEFSSLMRDKPWIYVVSFLGSFAVAFGIWSLIVRFRKPKVTTTSIVLQAVDTVQ
jgi:hypothetical protein